MLQIVTRLQVRAAFSWMCRAPSGEVPGGVVASVRVRRKWPNAGNSNLIGADELFTGSQMRPNPDAGARQRASTMDEDARSGAEAGSVWSVVYMQ